MKILAWLFRVYLSTLQRHSETQRAFQPGVQTSRSGFATFEHAAHEARWLGEAYRGVGVAIGLLGAVVVFCALIPTALEWPHDPSAGGVWIEGNSVITAVKLSLMCAILGLIAGSRKLRLKERWLDARLAAEHFRYMPLRIALGAARARAADAMATLQAQVREVLAGSPQRRGQIAYHAEKMVEYERCQAFATRITYIGFGISFTAALAHFWVHYSWLIFLTVFVPVLVATMHAVNGFLRLPQLVTQHTEMHTALVQIEARANSTLDDEQWIALADELLQRLSAADSAWTGMVMRQHPEPV